MNNQETQNPNDDAATASDHTFVSVPIEQIRLGDVIENEGGVVWTVKEFSIGADCVDTLCECDMDEETESVRIWMDGDRLMMEVNGRYDCRWPATLERRVSRSH